MEGRGGKRKLVACGIGASAKRRRAECEKPRRNLRGRRSHGRPRDVLAAQLRAFKAGTRPSTIMGQLSKGFSEQQIDQLAAYFSAVKP